MLEIPDDLGHAIDGADAPWDWQRWQEGFQSWHDYFAHLQPLTRLEAPANLTVLRDATNGNIVQWAAVPGATSYSVDRSTGPNSWASLCSNTPNSSCTDNQSTGTAFAYRVIATNGNNPDSPYSYVALFLSDEDTDGYVARKDPSNIKTPFPHASEPGIRAGEDQIIGGQLPHMRGFLSFNTALSNATILTAKLRLKQKSPDTYFDTLQPCMVDIEKGRFSGNEALQASDYGLADTLTAIDAFQLSKVGPDNWFEADLSSLAGDLNSNGYTQMRIYFNETQTQNRNVGWYSGDSTNNEPQLIVRYQP